jgi:small-conductance mechanosensitive channel
MPAADLAHKALALLTHARVVTLVRAGLILVLGLIAARLASRAIGRLLARNQDVQQSQLLRRVTAWGLFGVALAWALQELGFKLGVLLGAAGVATVAIGFASQTSLSNLISGFFLFGERPFSVGDLIEIEGVAGEVLAVDLIATKIRTFDNHYVRIPNEVMFKTKVVNLTRFPIRRFDLPVPVAYDEDLDRVRELLLCVCERNELSLAEPAPLCFVLGFKDSSVQMQLSVWSETTTWFSMKTSLCLEIKRALDEHGVRRPYPHRVIEGDASGPA